MLVIQQSTVTIPTMKNNPEIDFYRGDAVHTVLKRYSFTDDEKKVIQIAILTSKKDQPNMKLINDADNLLRSVTETQKSLEPEEFTMDKKSLRKMAELKGKKEEKSKFSWVIILLVIQSIGLIIFNYYLSDDKKIEPPKLYSFQEAETLCKVLGVR